MDRKIIQSGIIPQFSPTKEEATLLRQHKFTKLSYRWRLLAPQALRTLIYRGILGLRGLEPFAEDAVMEHELLILARLVPAVWSIPGRTRNLQHAMCIHHTGLCLSCHATLDFSSSPELMPLKLGCHNCLMGQRYLMPKLPFWQSIREWPIDYQREAMQYLIQNSKPISQKEIYTYVSTNSKS